MTKDTLVSTIFLLGLLIAFVCGLPDLLPQVPRLPAPMALVAAAIMALALATYFNGLMEQIFFVVAVVFLVVATAVPSGGINTPGVIGCTMLALGLLIGGISLATSKSVPLS